MKAFMKLVGLCTLLVALAGCNNFFPQGGEVYCSPQKAHKVGFSHGKNNVARQNNYGYSCADGSAAAVTSAYLEGYRSGLDQYHATLRSGDNMQAGNYNKKKSQANNQRRQAENNVKKDPNAHQCIKVNGKEVCGYHCTKTGGEGRCAPTPKQRCVSNEFGQIACGYNCKKTVKGVACGQSSAEKCVTDVLGNISCGNKCRSEAGKVVCG